ncbi:MAG: phosphatidylserine decarboxylase family protein [Bacteroidetes bacterium]|nr:phosphatidylserine decarboxylase family protein [Bacteroidota bacterium]
MLMHREGYKIIIVTLLILAGLNIAVMSFLGDIHIVSRIVLAISLVFFILILQFFRNPARNTILNENHVIAPADGTVVVIEEVEEPEYFKDKRKQVSIFMSPINVHVNRNPISGTVKYAKYHPGKYLVAWHPKSSTENERTTVVIANSRAEVLFRQIAGALAKRIVYYVKEGDQVQQGGEMGFIKFGSRIDLYLPLTATIHVTLQQKAKGGETVVATLA